MKRILKPVTYVLATLYFLADAAFMAIAKPISDWLRQCQPGQDPSKCSRRILLLSHEWRVVPWPESWINHSAWVTLIIGSQVRALVPPPFSRP